MPRDRSAKCERKQARAKQHKACRGYREESIGHEVIMTHRSPAAPDHGPNLLKNSKSVVWQRVPRKRSGSRTKAIKCVGEENAAAHQGQNHRNCINHRSCPWRPRIEQNDVSPRTVKRISRRSENRSLTDDLEQQLSCCSSPHSAHPRRFQRKRPRCGSTWGRLTEPPTEGGWFLAGCSARSTPPSADNSICSVKNRSRNLCRETGFFCPAQCPAKRPPEGGLSVWRWANGKRPQARPAASG